MKSTVLMEEMTWKEIGKALEQGKDTALVVAASIEQHGPHLPTGTDTLIGYALAKEVATRLGTALVAPLIRPGLSRHHMDFPGSMTLELKTFVKVVEEYCSSLLNQGFRNAVLFVSHGGNSDALKAVIPFIAKKVAPDLRLLMVHPMEKTIASLHAFLREKGVSRGKAGVHAGFIETSLMLLLRPDLVNLQRLEPGLSEESFYEPENIAGSKMESFIYGIRSQSGNGVLGDPTGSSPEIGKEMFETMVNALVDEIRGNLS